MVSSTAPWLLPHLNIYNEILSNLKAEPVTGTAADFLEGRALKLLARILDSWVYKVSNTGEKVVAPADGKEPAIFWDGHGLVLRPYTMEELAFWDYLLLAKRISRLATKDTLIVDLGAGTGLQTIFLRALGCKAPVLCLEMFLPALEIGQTLSKSLNLQNVGFGALNLALAENLPELGNLVGRDRPVMIISRQVLYPFFSEEQYSRLFDYLIGPLKVSAGIHLERTGRFTPAFARLQDAFGGPLKTPPKHQGMTDDPMEHLVNRPDIAVGEHHEIWPHYLGTYFPRYVQWQRR